MQTAGKVWLCNHAIVWDSEARLCCVAGPSPSRKIENIPYDCLHSWKGNCEKLAPESQFLFQKLYILTWAHKITLLEPLDL